MLITARFVQGIGGAVSSAVILAMIVTLFPKPGEQAKAFGVVSFVAPAGAAIGLLAGGLITQAVRWPVVFFVNPPNGIATPVAAARLLDGHPRRGGGHGAGVPAGRDRDGPVLAPAVGAADQQVRPACNPGRGAACDCRRPCHARPRPDQCRLCDVPAGAARTPWVGWRALVPGADNHRDV